MAAYREVKAWLHVFLISAVDGVRCQLHAQAILTQGRVHPVPFE